MPVEIGTRRVSMFPLRAPRSEPQRAEALERLVRSYLDGLRPAPPPPPAPRFTDVLAPRGSGFGRQASGFRVGGAPVWPKARSPKPEARSAAPPLSEADAYRRLTTELPARLSHAELARLAYGIGSPDALAWARRQSPWYREAPALAVAFEFPGVRYAQTDEHGALKVRAFGGQLIPRRLELHLRCRNPLAQAAFFVGVELELSVARVETCHNLFGPETERRALPSERRFLLLSEVPAGGLVDRRPWPCDLSAWLKRHLPRDPAEGRVFHVQARARLVCPVATPAAAAAASSAPAPAGAAGEVRAAR